ncbi:MAG: YiiD C-terminal domain-containing protein [Nevskia sp.]|nr:YiiD C-terminal domain-containing protein [Nevskia sp.]
MTPDSLTDFLHSRIPLTAAMQLRVQPGERHAIEVRAPLAPNINVHQTAFGGSLVTLAIVAGWTLLHQALQQDAVECAVFVQKSQCEYLLPARGELSAAARLPADAWREFLADLRLHGRARIEIEVTVSSGGQAVARHLGSFVAKAPPAAGPTESHPKATP